MVKLAMPESKPNAQRCKEEWTVQMDANLVNAKATRLLAGFLNAMSPDNRFASKDDYRLARQHLEVLIADLKEAEEWFSYLDKQS